eukprot:scaffold2914_cov178-Amphora_coffeaeformis.AAC.3
MVNGYLASALQTALVSSWSSANTRPLALQRPRRSILPTVPLAAATRVYDGPILPAANEIVAGFGLAELGLDLAVAPSVIVPGTYGLFVALSEGVESTTVPALQLLCGYAGRGGGTFSSHDEGDKTVGFALAAPTTAVFFEQQLMSVMDALELAAGTMGNGACGLAGHVLVQEEKDEVEIFLDAENTDFKRFYVPALVNKEGQQQDSEQFPGIEQLLSVGNIGQFCNDLAWSYDDPPKTKQEYEERSLAKNAVQLVWRLEFDEESRCLVPTWPVSVLAQDMVFENADAFMELGTKYGWNYWQATIDMETLQNLS